MPVKKTLKIGEGKAGPGRPKGQPNKTTALLKDALLLAAEKAGDNGGLVGYLENQARSNPQAFLTLLGKVLPLQVRGDPDAPVVTRIETIIVDTGVPRASPGRLSH